MSEDVRVVTIVQARMDSARLPGKALRPLCGKPLVLHALERARAMGWMTWLATTDRPVDELLVETVVRAGFPVYRGPSADVLRRVLETAWASTCDVVVRVTGDCPLFAPDVGRAVAALYLQHRAGIASNDTAKSGWPDGMDAEAFAVADLEKADRTVPAPDQPIHKDQRARAALDREHVTPWLRRERPHHVLAAPADMRWKRTKLSVDSEEDFERVRQVMARLDGRGYEWAATSAALALGGKEEETA